MEMLRKLRFLDLAALLSWGCGESSLRTKVVKSDEPFEKFEEEYVRKVFLPPTPAAPQVEAETTQRERGPVEITAKLLEPQPDRAFKECFKASIRLPSDGSPATFFAGESIRYASALRTNAESGTTISEGMSSPAYIGKRLWMRLLRRDGQKVVVDLLISMNQEDPVYSYVRWVPLKETVRQPATDQSAKVMLGPVEISAALMVLNERREATLELGNKKTLVFGGKEWVAEGGNAVPKLKSYHLEVTACPAGDLGTDSK
ncbi:MAG: hypothetical protein L0Y78_09755 [candidate division NC10 bacterium]|nr:hypothetical protein [candidate division NC10 bacterium]